MKFYAIDGALEDAINAAQKPVRLKIQIDINGEGHFESVFESDIIEAHFYGLKEKAGGTTARGDVLLDNQEGIYSYTNVKPGTTVKVSFSLGEGLPYFERFVLYLDKNGIQDIKGPGRKRQVRLGLEDFSAKLCITDEARDWTAPAVFTYMVICDKTQPEKSLLHCIAKRAGLTVSDIDCSTIPVTLPYVKLRRNIWAELSSLATAYRCHVECAPEKPLVFAHSPYQTEPLSDEEISYTFTGEHIYYLRKTEQADQYRNTVRLKINLPVSLEKQEIWRYEDPPVFYDDFLKPYYPFRYPLVREIEAEKYEAHYRIIDTNGKERNVVYADEIDNKEEAENRLAFDGGPFSYTAYDITTHCDRAALQLHKDHDGDIYTASIYGRPIVLDLNRSCFLRDSEAVERYGTAALNVTGSYFSEYEINGKPQYEDWVTRELEKRLQNQRELTIKTHRALFNARIGARIKIKTKNEESEGVITSLGFIYNCNEPFTATFKINEKTGGMHDEG